MIKAEVNYAAERAKVRYVAGMIGRSDLVAAVRKAGYDVVEVAQNEDVEDAEALARAAEVRHQTQRLIVGIVFSLPLLVISMESRLQPDRRMGAWPGIGSSWRWRPLCSSGWAKTSRGCAYKSLRNGSASGRPRGDGDDGGVRLQCRRSRVTLGSHARTPCLF
ncbi:MAG: hypothetical protein R2856_26295 [Caldilineaceae bacterium]